jgi:hypothetical protein
VDSCLCFSSFLFLLLSNCSANSLDITVVIKHDVANGKMVAEDHSSVGITANNYVFDGQPKTITAKDGKTSLVTAELVQVPWPIPSSAAQPKAAAELERNPTQGGAGGCVRILTILPDNAGETTDTRCLVEEGKVMRQHLLYKKDGKQASIMRYLTNQHYDKAKYQASLAQMAKAFSSSSASPAAPEVAGGSGASEASSKTPRSPIASSVDESRPRAPSVASTASSNNGSTTSTSGGLPSTEGGLDPFFVSLSGSWLPIPSNGTGGPSEPTLDGLWKSMGAGWLSRKIAGSLEITYKFTHTKTTFSTEDRSSLGTFSQSFKLDGRWRPVRQVDGKWMLTRAVQNSGKGDKGTFWLGELGWVPKAWRSSGRAGIVGSAIDYADAVEAELFGSATSAPADAASDSASDVSSTLSEDDDDGDHFGSEEESSTAGVAMPPLPMSPSPSAASASAKVGALPKLPAGTHAHSPSNSSAGGAAPLTISRLSSSSTVGAGGAAAGGAAATTRRRKKDPLVTLAPEVRGPSAILKRYPVKAAGLSLSEVMIETALYDVSSEKDALLAKADDLSSEGPSPLPNTPRCLVDYVSERRSSLSVTYRHIGADGAVLYTLTRNMQRKESQSERIMAEVADSARVQHGCTIIVSRRAVLDEMKAVYYAKLKEIAEEKRKKREQAAAAAAGAAGGASPAATAGAGAKGVGAGVKARPVSKKQLESDDDDDEDDDDDYDDGSLSAEGGQCTIQ